MHAVKTSKSVVFGWRSLKGLSQHALSMLKLIKRPPCLDFIDKLSPPHDLNLPEVLSLE